MGELTIAQAIAESSATVLIVLFVILSVIAFKKNWVYLGREVDQRDQTIAYRDKQLEKAEADKNEYKTMAFKAVGLGERLAKTAADVSKEGHS